MRDVLGKAAYVAEINKRGAAVNDTWEEIREEVKERYRVMGEASVKAYYERPKYATMRHEAIQTIYALVTSQNGVVSPEAILHLGMFMAMCGGHDET